MQLLKSSNVIFDGPTPPARWNLRVRKLFASLKVRITLASVAALAFGIAVSTAMLLQRAERDTLLSQQDRELQAVVRATNNLSHRVVQYQRALGAVARQLDRATLADPAKLFEFIRTKPVLRELFASIYVAQADGQVQVVADNDGVRRLDLNVLDRDYFRLTLNEQRPVVSEALPSRINGQPVVVFTYPLKDANGLYAVLGGALSLTNGDLLSDMIGAPGVNSGMTLVVTDAKGRILAHPSPDRLLHDLGTEARFSHAFEQWVESGSPVEPSGLRLEQAGEMVNAAGVAGPDWMLWRATPKAEMLAPLHAAQRQALFSAMGLIAAMALPMLALLWWLLRPLTQLEHRAQNLFNASGDPHAGWPEGEGEIGRVARVLRHVSAERAQLEGFNAAVLSKLGSVMAAAPVGIAFTRAQRFELVSTEFCRLFGRTEQELLGEPAQMIFSSNADYQSLGPKAELAFATGEAYVGEWQMLRADGSLFWARLRGRPVDANDTEAGSIWTLNDIDEQIAARAQLEWSATHDVLTGLANRKAFEERLTRVFDALPRSMPSAVVVIDLDHFKPINDTAGHAAGDAMLKAVAAAITSRVRASDLVVRMGGDEFALLLERCPQEVAMRIAESVRTVVADIALPWDRRTLRVGASIGVATLNEQTASIAAWLAEADAACYKAKAEGRGTVRFAGLRVVGGNAGE